MKRTTSERRRLRVLRAECGLSQMDVAASLGIGHHRYWRIENGFQEPTDDERRAMARIFGVAQADLGIKGVA